MGFIFSAVSFLGGWIALAVLALAISAGLYIACDYAEEYSSIVKKYLLKFIYVVSATYLLLIIDGLPPSRCIFGIFTHLSYLSLLSTFPFVQPISIQTIGSFLLTIMNHLYWFHYFVSEEYSSMVMNKNKSGNITNAGMKVLGFLFVFVWLTPIGFFVSLQSIEDSLPMSSATSGNIGGSAGGGISGSARQQKKGGIFKGFVDAVLVKKEQMFPGVSKRQY